MTKGKDMCKMSTGSSREQMSRDTFKYKYLNVIKTKTHQ